MSSVRAHHAANHGTTRMKTLEVDSTVEGQHEHRHVRVMYATSACISLKIIGRFVEFMSTRFVVSITRASSRAPFHVVLCSVRSSIDIYSGARGIQRNRVRACVTKACV